MSASSMPSAEHVKRVGWVQENLLKSQQYVNRDVYTVTVIRDGDGNLVDEDPRQGQLFEGGKVVGIAAGKKRAGN